MKLNQILLSITIAISASRLCAEDALTISPSSASLLIPKDKVGPDQKAELKLQFGKKDLIASDSPICTLTPSGEGMPSLNLTGKTATVSAPAALGPGVKKLSVVLKCSLTNNGKSYTATAQVDVEDAEEPAWEARAIAGYHQAGASSASFTQNFFFDFLAMRGLGSHARIYDNRVNLWGDVRIASAPQQISTPINELATGLGTAIGNIKVNELALSAEYQIGLEYKLHLYDQGARKRMLGAVAFGGSSGSFDAPTSKATVLSVPEVTSPQYPLFHSRFAGVSSPYVAFVPPDRQRFNRFYGAGLRLTSFDVSRPYAPPSMFTLTVGQDENITGGTFKGVVSRVDVFYPLPIGKSADGRWDFLFLFGTVNQWWHRDSNETPLALALAKDKQGTAIPITDSKVSIVTQPTTRDTYRIGFGIDLVNILKSWQAAKKSATKIN